VLTSEAVVLPGGAPLIVAGPWAKSTAPPTINPSYLMPGIFEALGRLTGDPRWRAAAGSATAMIGALSDGGRRLPPDWARLSNNRLVPATQPNGSAAIQYGLDAARLPIWFATACSGAARGLAASWWRNILGSDSRSGAMTLGLTGATINPGSFPLTLLAAAAAAHAAGDSSAASRLRSAAQTAAKQRPTYYGDAWAALGPLLLDGTIDPCD
jgi:endo-1,4-beta-D-glucanase Y